jgi:hypothetical protein
MRRLIFSDFEGWLPRIELGPPWERTHLTCSLAALLLAVQGDIVSFKPLFSSDDLGSMTWERTHLACSPRRNLECGNLLPLCFTPPAAGFWN